jgi:hypothetical protein
VFQIIITQHVVPKQGRFVSGQSEQRFALSLGQNCAPWNA